MSKREEKIIKKAPQFFYMNKYFKIENIENFLVEVILKEFVIIQKF